MSSHDLTLEIVREMAEEEKRKVLLKLALEEYTRNQGIDRECATLEIADHVLQELKRGSEGIRSLQTLFINFNKLLNKGIPLPKPKSQTWTPDEDGDRISPAAEVLHVLEEHWESWNGHLPKPHQIRPHLLPRGSKDGDMGGTIKRVLKEIRSRLKKAEPQN
jgi:hypothetical protein